MVRLMKISAKGRYAIVSMISIAQTAPQEGCVTVVSLSQRLGISKIYLEQVFSMLRRSGLVNSIKGAQGGYQLSRPAPEISAFDILLATETSMFEDVDETVKDTAPAIESAMRGMLFGPINKVLANILKSVSLMDLLNEVNCYSNNEGYMYYL